MRHNSDSLLRVTVSDVERGKLKMSRNTVGIVSSLVVFKKLSDISFHSSQGVTTAVRSSQCFLDLTVCGFMVHQKTN